MIYNHKFDVVVVGGGHAGIEAALATARLGLATAMITLNPSTIGKMSCNPAIGGLAKGHLVREIDALGGEMAKLIDSTGIHFKILNKSKGPAVWSPRAQADRLAYMRQAQKVINNTPNLQIVSGSVTGLKTKNNSVCGVIVDDLHVVGCRAAILTCGTFLNGKIHIGLNNFQSGRAGEKSATGLTKNLSELGFKTGRLKTGTPPRVHIDSIDFSKTEPQYPDNPPVPFSFQTTHIDREQILCYITYTNKNTHSFLESGLDRSPIYTGTIQGLGPRYCPSIEDKIVRFADKEHHQIFLEPEGYNNPEVYVNGFSTSLPADIQEKAIRTVPGLEQAKILRLGYAVEYDFFPSYQLNNTLETKPVENLYFAGQICGTSGYEEAGAQGLIAGINAALKLKGEPPLVLDRSEAYIGVLIDDLINKTILEPYRMFTSRAEFRLLLRHDNADLRLIERGYRVGLISKTAYDKTQARRDSIKRLEELVHSKSISPEAFGSIANSQNTSPINQPTPAAKLLKRPEIKLEQILPMLGEMDPINPNEIAEVEFRIKYEGFLRRQQELANKYERSEHTPIPESIDYDQIPSLSAEGREKLKQIRPRSIGQASRISGVRQGDLAIVMVYVERFRRRHGAVSRETVK